ncbi:MAG: sensor histidine kinase [Gemmatimonadaceae bacterium]
MRSLRAQVLALVVAAVLLTLSLFAYFGARTARLQFRSTIAATRELRKPVIDEELDTTFARGGMDAVREHVERARPLGYAEEAGLGDLAGGVLVVDTSGAIVVAADSSMRGKKAELLPGGRLRMESRSGEDIRLLHIRGGVPLRDASGDTVAFVFPLPQVEDGLEGATREFSRGFGRSLWLGVPALLLAAMLLALAVTSRLLDPIRRLTTAAGRIAAGEYGTRVGGTRVSELDELATSFDGMAASLERSEGARRQLMRDVAHELRAPLTNLKAQIEALQDGLRTPDSAALASLHEETTLLERLVADLDVVARAEAGRLDMYLDEVSLAPLVRSTADGFINSGRIDKSRLTVTVPDDLDVIGDRQRLGQILRNLVDNAIRHGGPGVTLEISASRVGEIVHVVVADTGRGLAAEHLPRVFDRLYRADASRTRGSGGAGLGLSIVKALVEAQGGSVRITSNVGMGTMVEVALRSTSDG